MKHNPGIRRCVGRSIGLVSLVLVVASVSGALPVAELERVTAVDFESEVLPVFNANCLACHNQTKAKAGLILETPAAILEGGDSGPSVVAGNPGESLLMVAAAHRDEDLVMPPVGNKSNAKDLSPSELALLRLWILQGAQGEVSGSLQLDWQRVASRVQPIYAMAMSESGRYVAYGRGNTGAVYEVPTGRQVGTLQDASVPGGKTHLDLVNAVAFHPNENLIATGGFREIKLWERQQATEQLFFPQANGGKVTVASQSADGLSWVRLDEGGLLQVVEVASGHVRFERAFELGSIRSAVLSAGGEWLALIAASNRLQIIGVSDGRPHEVPDLGPVLKLAWNPIGNRLAVLGADGTLSLLGFTRKSGFAVLKKRISPVESPVALEWIDGVSNHLILADRSGTVRRIGWDSEQPVGEFKLENEIAEDGLDARDDLVVVATRAGHAEVWDWKLGQLAYRLEGSRVERRRVREAKRLQSLMVGALDLTKARDKQLNEDLVKERERVTKAGEELKTNREAAEKARGEFDQATQALQKAQAAVTELDDQLAQVQGKVDAAVEASEEAAVRAKQLVEKLRKEQAAADPEESVEAISQQVDEALKQVTERAIAQGQFKAELAQLEGQVDQKKKEAEKVVADAKKQLETAEKAQAGSDRALTIAENEVSLSGKSVVRVEEQIAGLAGELKAKAATLAEGEKAVAAEEQALTAALKPMLAVGFLDDGKRIFCVGPRGSVEIFWAADGRALDYFEVEDGAWVAALPMTDVALGLIRGDGGVHVLRLEESWRLKQVLTGGFADRVNALDFSRDGRFLAAGGGDPSRTGEIKVWDLATLEIRHDLNQTHSDVVFSVRFSPDGKQIASGSADRFARVVELSSGKTIHSFEGHTHYVMDVSWKADGRSLVSAGGDGMAKVWDVTTGERKKNIEGFKKEVTGVDFLGDRAEVVASSGDASIGIYGLDGKRIRKLEGATTFLFSESVSADGRYVAAGSRDGILRIWDAPSGKVLTTLGE